MDGFLETPLRRTFTYCKPLVMEPGKPPVELSRLDSKNWTPTPPSVEDQLVQWITKLAPQVDAMILLDQVDVAETGVVTQRVLKMVGELAARHPNLPIVADSRRGLRGFPQVIFKMNATELSAMTGAKLTTDREQVQQTAISLAHQHGRKVFVTMAERGMVGASPDGSVAHVPSLPIRGPIDIVGAGDSVTANLATALAAGATMKEAMELAMAAASVVIHQLGTTGTASVKQIAGLCAQVA